MLLLLEPVAVVKAQCEFLSSCELAVVSCINLAQYTAH